MKGNIAFWFGLFGVILFIITTILGGLQFSDYSHISQLISESYAIGTPYGLQLRYYGFIPSGIFIAIFALLAIKELPQSKSTVLGFLGIGIFYGIGTVLVSLFPCDKGCDKELVNPSLSQVIHNLTGLLTYIIVPISLIVLGIAARKWENGKLIALLGFICGIACIFFVGLLSSDLQSKLSGLYQRMIEGSVLVWILACSVYLKHFSKK
jgi:DNA-binding transcriptional regulator of glucitol operon